MDGKAESPGSDNGKSSTNSRPDGVQRPGPITEQRRQQAVAEAYSVKKFVVPAALSGLVGADVAGTLGAKFVLDSIMFDAGKPTDPVERMMVEQLTLAHYRLTQLYARADSARTPEHMKILYGAANRLLGEMRRLALAVKAYRAPASPRAFTVVRQQNVASEQQVTFVSRDSLDSKDSLPAHGGLASNDVHGQGTARAGESLEDEHVGQRGFFVEQTQDQVASKGRRRAAQRIEAAAVE